MQIHLANSSQQKQGGGWSWIANINKALPDKMTSYDKADWYFIPSPTMVQRAEAEKAKQDGKKIALRIDNAVRNSRNRNTGMSRMKDFAQMADVVIYQSEWARQYLLPFTGVDGVVIHNSVDEEIFKGGNSGDKTFLYSRFNRDETKNWEMARYWYQMSQRENPDSKLLITGQFSDELREGNFDFFEDENFKYIGVITDPNTMADIYRMSEYLIYPYYNDACSNTLIEALMCGCKVFDQNGMTETGGAKEILKMWNLHGREYFSLERMGREYMEALSV